MNIFCKNILTNVENSDTMFMKISRDVFFLIFEQNFAD